MEMAGGAPAGTTNSVMLWAGSEVLRLDPVRDTSARRVIVLAAVSCHTRAGPDAVTWLRLRVTGVLPERTLLITITVSALSVERSAAKAARVSGLGTPART